MIRTLTEPGDVFLLVTEHGKAHCESWTVNPENRELEAKIGKWTHHVIYARAGTQLELTAAYNVDNDSSNTCSNKLALRETDDALFVDNAPWFRSAERCAAALAKHERVATSMPCRMSDPIDPKPQQRSHDRFYAILQRGGAMYSYTIGSDPTKCRTIKLAPLESKQGRVEGDLSFRVDGGTEAYTYITNRGRDQIDLLGPGGRNDDGSSWAMGCGDEVVPLFTEDSVSLVGEMYFSLARCKKALADQAADDSWLPADDVPAPPNKPLAGGC